MPRGYLGPGRKEKEVRHNPRYSLQDQQVVLGAPLADVSSHQRGYPKAAVFFSAPCRSHAPGSQGCGGSSCLGLVAPSHSPNFLVEWTMLRMMGLGHVKDEAQRRGEGEEESPKPTVFLQSCQDAPAWAFFPPSPVWVGSLPAASPACHASSAGVVLRHFCESIPQTSKPPPRPGRMTCIFSENWQAASVLYCGKRVNPFPPFLLLCPSPQLSASSRCFDWKLVGRKNREGNILFLRAFSPHGSVAPADRNAALYG